MDLIELLRQKCFLINPSHLLGNGTFITLMVKSRLLPHKLESWWNFRHMRTNISAGEAAYGIGATLHDAITANINTGFVDFSNPWYQRFIYQFDGEPKATGHAMKWQHDHKSQVTTYVRDSWPEGIRISISTQYLAFNDKTLIDPQVILKKTTEFLS